MPAMPKIPPSQPSLFGSPGEPDERFDPDPRMTLGEAMEEPAERGSPGTPPPVPPQESSARRPWWAGLLGWLMGPWVKVEIEPANPGEQIDARPVCYVLEDYGLSNALILDRACREAGLPSPLRPLPGDPLGRKRAYVALSRRSAGSALKAAAQQFAQRLALQDQAAPAHGKTRSESLSRLIEAHRAVIRRDAWEHSASRSAQVEVTVSLPVARFETASEAETGFASARAIVSTVLFVPESCTV